MAYTDTINNQTKIKSVHQSEIFNQASSLASSKKVSFNFSIQNETKISKNNIKNIQLALNHLEGSFSNNCCQANCCQSQSCQSCQKNCSCQSQCRSQCSD